MALPDPRSPVRSARSRRLATRPRDLGTAELRTGDQTIGLLPDRPAQWALYELPVETDYPIRQADTTPEGWTDPIESGRDRGGVLIETTEDAPVALVELEDQTGPADVVLVGPLRGITVVTRHRVAAPAGERYYLLIHGMLSRPGPSVVSGARLEPGAILGFVGDDEGTRLPELYFEVRQVRGSSVATPRQLSELVSASASMPADPRNVLPLR